MTQSKRAASFVIVVVSAAVALCNTARGAAPADDATSSAGVEFFENKIRPLLVEHCYECHSGKSEELQANLLLDTRAGLLKGGDSGAGIVPGEVEKSLLISAVRYKNEKLQMPPAEKLPDAQIADLETWVKMGAPDPRVPAPPAPDAIASTAPTTAPTEWAKLAEGRKWWAFQKPVDHAPPAVKDATWPRQPLDRFILAKLEANHLAPAPEAARRTLIRRAYFDLVGLPPPVAEVEAFVKDDSPDAYEKLIDTLLASPLYGQRWARHWLDVVRYTDSFDSRVLGNEQDVAFAWRYRDWVVDAFNRDLPYDQFVMQQVAGDLLPAPSEVEGQSPGKTLNKEGIVATGVYVMGEWGGGDSDKDKLITDIVDDQVDLTGRAFMGVTLACARCHDHKFDPISTRDYYGLAGIFFSTHILPDPGPKTNGPTNLRIPLLNEQELAQRKADAERVAQLDREMDSAIDGEFAALAAEMMPRVADYLAAAWEYRHGGNAGAPMPPVATYASQRGLNAYALGRWVAQLGAPTLKPLGKSVANLGDKPGLFGWRNADGGDAPIVVINTNAGPVETIASLAFPPRSVSLHPSPAGGVAVSWRSPIGGRVRVSGRVIDGHAACGDGIAWSLSRVGGSGAGGTGAGATGAGELASGTIANGGRQAFAEGTGGAGLDSVEVSAGDMIQLAVLPKVEYSCDTTQVEVEIVEITAGDGAGVGAGRGAGRTWKLAEDALAAPAQSNPMPDTLGNTGVWTFHDLAGQAQSLFTAGSPLGAFIATTADAAGLEATRAAAAEAMRGLREVDRKALADPRGPFWSPARGDDANLSTPTREAVTAKRAELKKLKDALAEPIPIAQAMQEGGTPKSMFAGVQDVPVHIRGRYDRLGDVVPRRFPQVIVGVEQPPITKGSGRLELAKWLAKPDHPLTARVMVNRLWQHHFGDGIVRTPNNFGKLGTPPTHPELLDHLAVQFVKSGWSVKAMHRAMMLSATYRQSSEAPAETFRADPGNELLGRMSRRKLEAEALRDSLLAAAGVLDTSAGGKAINDLNTPRRSLYVMTIRSDRSNYRSLFDAADASAIVEKRNDSTVAPQALFLMNHPFVIERAKQLAARVENEAIGDDAAKIDWLHRTLFARPAEIEEIEIGRKLVASGGPTAWQSYCHVLLCANEFMYVD